MSTLAAGLGVIRREVEYTDRVVMGDVTEVAPVVVGVSTERELDEICAILGSTRDIPMVQLIPPVVGELAPAPDVWSGERDSQRPDGCVHVMIVRPCYLAISAVVRSGVRPDILVVVDEPGRALSASDATRAICPVGPTITMPFDPAVARAVDAGLFSAMMPYSLRMTCQQVWEAAWGMQP